MQKVVVAESYVPVLPHRSTFWPSVFRLILPWFLRKTYGVDQFEFKHIERIQASIRSGHGIVLMPNHARDEDGLVMGMLSCQVGRYFYYMSSWHVFKIDRIKAFLLPRIGLYSVYREGADRAAVKTSVDMLIEGQRPLVIFPEGFLGRTNDRLNLLMDGPALIARTAARKRAQANPPGQVVIHPVSLRYRLLGPLEPAVANVLLEIEYRVIGVTNEHLPLRERVDKIGEILLSRKEVEYIGHAQGGSMAERLNGLIQVILGPLEDEWVGERHAEETVQARVRRLRVAIVPGLIQSPITEAERKRLWRHLADVYLAQQLDNYPPDYLDGTPTPERLLETIERFQEDLTDKLTPYARLGVTVTVGEAIIVNPNREGRGTTDPLLQEVGRQIRDMLGLPPETSKSASVSTIAP